MVKKNSGEHRKTRAESLAKLPPEMQVRLSEFEFGLHGIRDNTKEEYLGRMVSFGSFLLERGKKSFEEVERTDLDIFLNGYRNPSTKNVFIAVFRRFYKDKPEKVVHLKIYDIELQEILPSEVITPEEVVKLACEAGKKRELYKYVVLTLFESCARISEVLNLRVGDVQFETVHSKDGKRSLICTLFFRRSKGGIHKSAITLCMFSAEIQRWLQVHPFKEVKEAYLFPSPYLKGEPITRDVVAEALWNAMQRTKIGKPSHPHWLRHSGLSWWASKGHSTVLLGVRTVWFPG